ncbi:MAG: FAD-binding oxidoreductase [Steroidobacteraceae bacterium]|jgi:FAD/FMN-containing dehydrogenase
MKRRDLCKLTMMASAAAASPTVFTRLFATESPVLGGRDLQAVTFAGRQTVIPAAAVKAFAAGLRGRVLTADDPDYEQARRIWNKMIDRRPALIARCSGAADVARAVAFARERELLVAVRGGGHSFPGYSTCDGGLVIDLSAMRGVRVDPQAKIARVAGGAWNGDLDWEAQQYGLATPMGRVSHTGVAGLTLSGGYGRLSRLYALACDNILSVDLITADAQLLHASAQENPDLFWALHGGGGNFGVVSSFEFQLHPVAPSVMSGNLTYAPAQARNVLEYYGEFAARAPRELELGLSIATDEAGARYPVLGVFFVGDPGACDKVLEPLRTAIKPRRDTVRIWDYMTLQQRYDGPTLSDENNYVKGGFVAEFSPALADTLMSDLGIAALGDVGLMHCGGAIADVAPTATAVAHRSELFQMGIEVGWKDSADNERNRAKIHAAWDRLSRFTSGFYVNLNVADQKAVEDNFGVNRTRLAQLKKQYDPRNLFRLNANILPSA